MGHRRPGRAAFSLVELLAVIAIIGLISAAVTLAVSDQADTATLARVRADLTTLDQALELFRLHTKRHARSIEELWVRPADVPKWGPAYVKHTPPHDPWGRPYLVERAGGRAAIKTLGADGAPGGAGLDADRSTTDLGDPSW